MSAALVSSTRMKMISGAVPHPVRRTKAATALGFFRPHWAVIKNVRMNAIKLATWTKR